MAAPSFYCENCCREVSSSLDTCPGCGQQFYSVRCPACGFTGASELFIRGCPGCGFAGAGILDSQQNSNKLNGANGDLVRKIKPKKKFSPWLYRSLIILLIITLFILIRIYFLL